MSSPSKEILKAREQVNECMKHNHRAWQRAGSSGTIRGGAIGKAKAWYPRAQHHLPPHHSTQGSRESESHISVSPLVHCEALKTEDNFQGAFLLSPRARLWGRTIGG